VVKNRDALASGLAVDEVRLIVERVRGNGGHAGRVSVYVADEDPYASPPLRTPLLGVARRDSWRPVPFGRDAPERRIDLPLVWTFLLVGAIPRFAELTAMLAEAGDGAGDPIPVAIETPRGLPPHYAVGGSTRSTRWRWPATGSGIRCRARSPTMSTR
jgi:hypothetical protein